MAAELELCQGCQLVLLSRELREIDWEPEAEWTERVRVCEYACACKHVLYELCQAGGLRFVRKIKSWGRRRTMEASPRMNAVRANLLWRQWLCGRFVVMGGGGPGAGLRQSPPAARRLVLGHAYRAPDVT
ncbi:hypothetical protein GCM10010149_60300 [Nonomuraea roseoviolacea subsp. roseoviolacea]